MARVDAEPAVAPLQRTVVIGTGGAGKSTLARQLALLQGTSPREPDALERGPQWTPRPLAASRGDVEAAVQRQAQASEPKEVQAWTS